MGKSYKHYDNGAQRPIKLKRDKAKRELKELPSKLKAEEDSYNSLKVDFDDEYNFEKFKRRK